MKDIILLTLLLSSMLSSAQKDRDMSMGEGGLVGYTGVVVGGCDGVLSSRQPLCIQDGVILDTIYGKVSVLNAVQIYCGNFEVEIYEEKMFAGNVDSWSQVLNVKEVGFMASFVSKDVTRILYMLRNMSYMNFKIDASKNVKTKITGKLIAPERCKDAISTFGIPKYEGGTIIDVNMLSMPILQTVVKRELGRQLVGSSVNFVWGGVGCVDEEESPVLVYSNV